MLMQTFLQSAFLQALGYAIANSLWQVAFLWLIVVLINNIGRLSSSKKYFAGIVAQFTGFVWFLCTLEIYYSRCKQALEIPVTASLNNNHAYVLEPSINNFSSAILYFSVKAEQLLPYLSIAYLCMLFFLFIRLSRAFYSTQQIRKNGLQKADIELRLFVKRTAAYLGNKNDLLSRVKRMLNQQEKSHGYRNQVFALMLITIMLSCAAWFNPGIKYNSAANQTSAETRKI